jgi:hypothetical protein
LPFVAGSPFTHRIQRNLIDFFDHRDFSVTSGTSGTMAMAAHTAKGQF